MLIFTILDTVSKIHGEPFTSPNNDTAKRSFSRAVNDCDTTIHQNPDNFQLINIGTWDNKEGKIIAHSLTEIVATGDELINPIEA